jgi:hypothetical protein
MRTGPSFLGCSGARAAGLDHAQRALALHPRHQLEHALAGDCVVVRLDDGLPFIGQPQPHGVPLEHIAGRYLAWANVPLSLFIVAPAAQAGGTANGQTPPALGVRALFLQNFVHGEKVRDHVLRRVETRHGRVQPLVQRP